MAELYRHHPKDIHQFRTWSTSEFVRRWRQRHPQYGEVSTNHDTSYVIKIEIKMQWLVKVRFLFEIRYPIDHTLDTSELIMSVTHYSIMHIRSLYHVWFLNDFCNIFYSPLSSQFMNELSSMYSLVQKLAYSIQIISPNAISTYLLQVEDYVNFACWIRTGSRLIIHWLSSWNTPGSQHMWLGFNWRVSIRYDYLNPCPHNKFIV